MLLLDAIGRIELNIFMSLVLCHIHPFQFLIISDFNLSHDKVNPEEKSANATSTPTDGENGTGNANACLPGYHLC